MFFFLSKTAGYLAQPLVIVCLLFLAGLLWRNPKRKRALLLSSFIVLLVFSNQFLAVTAMRLWEIPPIPFSELKGTYDYGIVLTGVTKGTAGPGDRVYFGGGADRATHAMQLYKLGLVRKVLISGGSGKLIDTGPLEADELAGFMTVAGVPATDIVIENKSSNTHDSAVEVARMLSNIPAPRRLLLVTSGYHIRRARACFVKAGLEVDIFPADPLAGTGPITFDMFIIPKVESFGVWQHLFKEMAGMVAYKIAGYI